MIKLSNVHKTYATRQGQVTALTDINLSVAPGEIYGVIGRSGAGKSTLIRCVNLLERPTQGVVEVNGQELTGLSPAALRQARQGIGMVFQHFNLLSTATVYDNIALPLRLLNKSSKEIDSAVVSLLTLTGLMDRQLSYPSQLSGGQKQRVAIARALATKPKVLLCDEMTSSLDPETTEAILELVKTISEQMKLSTLLITHEMGVIKKVADRVAVMDAGRIIEQADVVSLFKSPQSDIAKSFTESMINTDLPLRLHQQLTPERTPGAHAVLRVAFTGKAAAEPVINELIKRFKVQLNILQANLEFLRSDTIGMMIVTVWGEPEETDRVILALQQKGLTVEVLGYVAADDGLLI
jgi:D-methionine transport system ATP-binding protein